jgi:hypothetical protein
VKVKDLNLDPEAELVLHVGSFIVGHGEEKVIGVHDVAIPVTADMIRKMTVRSKDGEKQALVIGDW